MINLYEVPNSQIEQAIVNLYKTEKNRNILRDRVIGGMTYDRIIERYFPESDWWGRRDYDLTRDKMQKMVDKLTKTIQKDTAEEGE